MIFGTDTSKYQPPGTYQPGEFEIINAEDPTMPTKVARNVGDRRPWSLYVWVYGGESGAHLVDRLQAGIARAGSQPTLLAGWWDFEDTGVQTWQVIDACNEARRRGLETGYYSNTWRIDHSQLGDFAYWPCAYPGRNDGSFPGFPALGSPRPAQLWQYSSGGGLDRNVVVDENWYFRVTSGQPAPAPQPKPKRGWNMAVVGHHWPDNAAPSANDDWYAIDGGILLHSFGGDRQVMGIPQEARTWLDAGCPISNLSDGDLALLKKRSDWPT